MNSGLHSLTYYSTDLIEYCEASRGFPVNEYCKCEIALLITVCKNSKICHDSGLMDFDLLTGHWTQCDTQRL